MSKTETTHDDARTRPRLVTFTRCDGTRTEKLLRPVLDSSGEVRAWLPAETTTPKETTMTTRSYNPTARAFLSDYYTTPDEWMAEAAEPAVARILSDEWEALIETTVAHEQGEGGLDDCQEAERVLREAYHALS